MKWAFLFLGIAAGVALTVAAVHGINPCGGFLFR